MMNLTAAHIQGLRKRAIDPMLAASLGVHSVDEATVGFAYRRQDQLHNVKLRRGKGNMPWAEQGKPLSLWNVDCLRADPAPDEVLVITEGEFDALAMIQVGFNRVVSVPNGAPSKGGEKGGKRYAYLYADGPASTRILPDVDKFRTIIIATDGDTPGMALRDELAARLGDERCLWVEWPEGCKDANDVLVKFGPDELRNRVYCARRMWIENVCRMSDIPDEGPERALTLGFHMFDDPIEQGGIRLPEYGFVTIAGPAHIGKSVFTRQLLWNLWRQHGRSFGLTALEEKAKPRYLRALRRLAIGKHPDQCTPEEIYHADIEIDRAMVIVRRPPRSLLDVSTLLATVEYSIKVYGIQVMCVDPVNEIERSYEGNGQRNGADEIGKMIMELKELADRYRVLMICVAHPPVDVVRRKRPTDVWTLYDVEGSRHWAGKSDAGFTLWRPHPNGPTMCNVPKLKSNEIFGKPDLFRFHYDPIRDTYSPDGRGFGLLSQIAADLESGIWDNPAPRAAAA